MLYLCKLFVGNVEVMVHTVASQAHKHLLWYFVHKPINKTLGKWKRSLVSYFTSICTMQKIYPQTSCLFERKYLHFYSNKVKDDR